MPIEQKEKEAKKEKKQIEPSRYGPNNPHPLSTRKTELVWEGKYDEWGNRREIDIAGMSMPMQKIETVDEPISRLRASNENKDQTKLNLLLEKKKKDDFRNMLIWGDNRLVMASLLKDFKGKIDLIYIDPPFDIGADFTMNVAIGEKQTAEKEQSLIEAVAYSDTWGKGTDSYLHMIYERLMFMRELMSETGSIYIHIGSKMATYVKLVMDEIFGKENSINDLVWFYKNKLQFKFARNFPRDTESVFLYAKCFGKHKFFHQYISLDKPRKQNKITWDPIAKKTVTVKDESGNVIYYESDKRLLGSLWEIPRVNSMANEDTGYDTQKPEQLLELIIKSVSEENDLVADFFCGSGTTGAVAEKLGRRWIMADLGRFAIHTSRKRLIDIQRKLHEEENPYRSFDVYNLGRYERQWWQMKNLEGADEEHRKVVLGFYKAEILTNMNSPLIHGRKGPALIYVDHIDSLLTREEVKAAAKAAREAGAKEVHCLAWEFEMNLKMICDEIEHVEGIKVRLVQIPREIMEKNRTEVTFLELAVLEAKPVIQKGKDGKKSVDIKLAKFIPSLAEVPAKELEELNKRALKSGFDFIDFWAVDFDYKYGKPFEHHWQDYRTRKDRTLKNVSDQNYIYPKKGKYTACVKVIDVFGADTSITIDIDYE